MRTFWVQFDESFRQLKQLESKTTKVMLLLNVTLSFEIDTNQVFIDLVELISAGDIGRAHCTSILLDSIGNYSVLDNGFPYAAGFVPCNGQFAQIALDTGLHVIIFTDLNTGCQDTLKAVVSCTADNGCGIIALSPLNLTVDNCSDLAQFCVTLKVSDLVNTVVTDNSGAFAGNIGFCDLDSTYIALEIDTGLHVLIIADTVKTCADTFTVNVTCDLVEDVAIDTTVAEGDSIVLCLDDFGYDVSTIDSVNIACLGNGPTTATCCSLRICAAGPRANDSFSCTGARASITP